MEPELLFDRSSIIARINGLYEALKVERRTPGYEHLAIATEVLIDAELDLLSHCDDAES